MESERDILNCVVWLRIKENIFRLSCCDKLICQECTEKLSSSKCPHCTSPSFETAKDNFVLNMLLVVKEECKTCKRMVAILEIDKHIKECK